MPGRLYEEAKLVPDQGEGAYGIVSDLQGKTKRDFQPS